MIAAAGGLLTNLTRTFGVSIRDHSVARPTQIAIVLHEPGWAGTFAAEAERLQNAVRNDLCFVDHVGSTAVPGLPAKPVIDLLVTLPDWGAAGIVGRELQALGYRIEQRVRGANPRHFMTRLDPSGGPTFNLHLVPSGSQ